MRLSWQSLNERPSGTIWREGRAWLWGKRQIGGPRLHFEWSHFHRPRLACTLAVNHGEPGWLFRLSFLLGTWYVGGGEYDFGARRFGFEVLDGDWVRVFLGRRDQEWREKASGWELSVHILDVLLGPRRYTQGMDEKSVRVLVPMPERSYAATVTMRNDRWKRARWPWAQYIRRANVEFDKGEQLPVPGKGESAWDCEQDAIFSSTMPARDVAEAVASVVESATRTRFRHGGVNWAPESKSGV